MSNTVQTGCEDCNLIQIFVTELHFILRIHSAVDFLLWCNFRGISCRQLCW